MIGGIEKVVGIDSANTYNNKGKKIEPVSASSSSFDVILKQAYKDAKEGSGGAYINELLESGSEVKERTLGPAVIVSLSGVTDSVKTATENALYSPESVRLNAQRVLESYED